MKILKDKVMADRCFFVPRNLVLVVVVAVAVKTFHP